MPDVFVMVGTESNVSFCFTMRGRSGEPRWYDLASWVWPTGLNWLVHLGCVGGSSGGAGNGTRAAAITPPMM